MESLFMDTLLSDPETLRTSVQAHGLIPPDIIEPGRFQSLPAVGDGKDRTDGWCFLSPDGIGGAIGDPSKAQIKGRWQAKSAPTQSKEQQADFRRQIENDLTEAGKSHRVARYILASGLLQNGQG